MVIAPLPKRVIPKGKAGPGLLAYLAVAKYVDHMPLYRLRKKFQRHGVKLSAATMGDWIAKVATYLGRRAIPCWLKIRSVPAGTAIMYRFCAHPDTPDCSSDQRIMNFCSGYQARKYLPRDLRCRCRVADRFRRVSPY